jgi:hypothetical protein
MTQPPISNGTGHLTVDTLNANLGLVEAYGYDPLPSGEHVTERYISRDGGGLWQARTFAGKPRIRRMARLGATTIASVGDQRNPNGGALDEGNIPFARSDDRMRTWRALDQPIVARGRWVTGFWMKKALERSLRARTRRGSGRHETWARTGHGCQRPAAPLLTTSFRCSIKQSLAYLRLCLRWLIQSADPEMLAG